MYPGRNSPTLVRASPIHYILIPFHDVSSFIFLMSHSTLFITNYEAAREEFLVTADMADFSVVSHVNQSVTGRYDETLAIDVAVYDPPGSTSVLICNSGIHGVEGIAGAACQRDFLSHWDEPNHPGSVKLVFIHALNPYGFSYWRRTNENNVDMNRNFADFDNDDLSNDDYAELHEALFPSLWDGKDKKIFTGALDAYVEKYGRRHTQSVATKGQYDHAEGLFYGGDCAQWSNDIFMQVIEEHIGGKEQAAFLDIHTGLGPYGHGELIFNGAIDDKSYGLTRRIFGEEIKASYSGQSVACFSNGLIVNAFKSFIAEKNFAGVSLEFGTLPVRHVFDTLRGECWHHIHSGVESDSWRHSKQKSLESFYIADTAWQEMIIKRFRKVIQSSLGKLNI